jgi:trehalose 6-phosphate synthase
VVNLLIRETSALGIRPEWIAALDETGRSGYDNGAGKDEPGWGLHPVPVVSGEEATAHDQIATRALWLAHHGLTAPPASPPADDPSAWAHFDRLNRRFARRAHDVSSGDGIILVNDYQLSTVPAHLRRLGPRAPVVFMAYTAFADPAAWSGLPERLRRRILAGLLGADIVGFTSRRWLANFRECARAEGATVVSGAAVEHHGRTVELRTYPVFADVAVTAKARAPRAQEFARRIRSLAPGFIFGKVERLDPAKNAVLAFEGFEALLARRPDLGGRVTFVACLSPTRQHVAEYRSYRQRLETAVRGINERYPNAAYLFVTDDLDHALGVLGACDALVVNAPVDGMNLVAQELVLINPRAALVISEGVGSADVLSPHAVVVDRPRERRATTCALETAADMSIDERTRRAACMREALTASRASAVGRILVDAGVPQPGSPSVTPS